MTQMNAVIILPHLKIQNVNTISSPLTWGFPSITAILGFTHALERALKTNYNDLKFNGVSIVCHQFKAQTYQANNFSEHTMSLTRNPLKKDGATPSLNEEGRAHMEISLILQAAGDVCTGSEIIQNQFKEEVINSIQILRVAGGSIIPNLATNKRYDPKIYSWPHYEAEQQIKLTKNILKEVLPGFILIHRHDLLVQRALELQQKNPELTTLEALMEFSSIRYEPDTTDLNEPKSEWTIRKKPGWIVPLPIGYQAISELYPPGKVKNARDMVSHFQFVENIYSLGQWVSPHRFNNIHDIFWSYDVNLETGLYLCKNNPQHFIKTLT